MKKVLLAGAAFLLLGAASSLQAQVANYPSAVGVLGPSNFTTSTTTAAGVCDDHQLRQPHGVAFDPATGKLFVADRKNHRVLRFSSANALGSGASAEAVFGQVNFTTTTATAAAPSTTTLADPIGLTIDDLGRLWVCDFGNNRVLRFDNASSEAQFGATADAVYGQASFTVKQTTTYTAADMYGPCVAQYYNNTLYVADWGNNRVLRFDNIDAKPTTGGATADAVFGQADFTTKSQNRGGALATCGANTMSQPNGLHVDANGTLWVSDNQNCRILRFDNPGAKASGAAADGVLGQPDFTHNTSAATIAGVSNAMRSVWSDASGRLYGIQEGTATAGNRVMWYNDAAHKANGASADGVIGQPNFTSTAPGTTAQQFNLPKYMAINNATGDIWISDQTNNRVLRFRLDDALPVELVSFNASCGANTVTLSWKTATEKNNYGFDVERRSNGGSWQKVGFVGGNGTSSTPNNYSFADQSAVFGRLVYRLKQIDTDGKVEYSKEIEVEAGSVPSGFYVGQNYPNPFNPSTTIRFAAAENTHATVIVYDQLGRTAAELFNGEAEGGKLYELKFDGSRLSSGMYFYRIATPVKTEVRSMILTK